MNAAATAEAAVTPVLLVAILLSEISTISGQILLKKAMNQTNEGAVRFAKFAPLFGAGIAAMSLGFFLWLGLLSKLPLSYLYPFEGLDRLILAFAASFFLKEKMTFSLWIGLLMITAGILLVSVS